MFRYIENDGSPTRWNIESYQVYRDKSLRRLPDDLLSMVDDRRYGLGHADTFWHAILTSMHATKSTLSLVFDSDRSSKRFEFAYEGVLRVTSQFTAIEAPPALIVQELTILKGGVYRHALVDLIGRYL